MKERLLRNWDFARGLRLVFAVIFLAAGIANNESVAYAAAAIFGVQAQLNIGCCGASCAPKQERNTADVPARTEFTYEEIR